MKKLRSLVLPALLGLFVVEPSLAAEPAAPVLDVKVYNADGNSFHVNSVLLTGKTDAVLIDAQFTRADAHRLVAEILASGKKLKAVYISHGDPDYYFGLEVIKQEFPDVKVYASAPTVAWIKSTVDKKVAFWGPKMGANAPKSPVIPEVLPGNSLDLEGNKLDVIGLDGDLPQRTFVWVPAIKAVVGGVNVFGGLHLWMADSQTKAQRAAWSKTLDRIAALHPAIVVPGHAAAGTPRDISQVKYSQEYLQAYEQALDKAASAADVIAAMKQKYPNAQLGIALDIGAKVNKGEMKW
ncbi:MAG TPA: MBL fold metallo-hydrolase [Rhodocyclaceae bacterium]|nr:MBL fold metallo-hydrolase [Rhodocyclaceae bacterium]